MMIATESVQANEVQLIQLVMVRRLFDGGGQKNVQKIVWLSNFQMNLTEFTF